MGIVYVIEGHDGSQRAREHTVVIPDRPTNRAAMLWIPIPEEATTMRP